MISLSKLESVIYFELAPDIIQLENIPTHEDSFGEVFRGIRVWEVENFSLILKGQIFFFGWDRTSEKFHAAIVKIAHATGGNQNFVRFPTAASFALSFPLGSGTKYLIATLFQFKDYGVRAKFWTGQFNVLLIGRSKVTLP